MENNHEVTNEELARMIGEGFHGVDEKLTEFRSEVNQRFDKIENFLLEDHRRRIEKLEGQVQELRDALAMK
jgi:hypothetical protein